MWGSSGVIKAQPANRLAAARLWVPDLAKASCLQKNTAIL
jgi:hypothetical protein